MKTEIWEKYRGFFWFSSHFKADMTIFFMETVILKEDECYECQISVNIGCGKPVAQNAMRYFTDLWIYWCERE